MSRSSKWLTTSGAIVVVAALLFLFVGVPALVRFPLDTDQTAYYRGTFTEYVDQQTLQPLAQPLRVPLTISRQVRAKSGGFSTAVVTEDDTVRPGPLTLHQDFQYVMNRRTMTFDNSDQTRMFSQPANSHVAGAIRVTFPFGTTRSGPYRMWSPETDTSSVLTNGSALRRLPGIEGPEVIEFSASVSGPPSPYYLKWLSANGFPTSISATQLEPRLAALGVDLPAVLATVLPRLTPSQQAVVTNVLASPVQLDYHFFYSGTVAVDPTTGMMIWSRTKAQGLDVTPSLSGIERVAPVLSGFTGLPAVAALQGAIDRLAAAPPQPVVSYDYVQTPSSARHMASLAQSQGQQIRLVGAIPWVAGGIGLVLVLIGLALTFWRGRPTRAAATHRRPTTGTGTGTGTSAPPDQRAA